MPSPSVPSPSPSVPPLKHSALQLAFDRWQEQARAIREDFIVAMIQRIVQEGAARKASDVHFQPSRFGVDVRMRLDGVLHQLGTLPLDKAPQIAARIKVLADMTTFKTSEPQDGRIRKGTIPEVNRDLRISTAPSLYGERIVIRFFSEGNRFLLPLELGFSREILKELSVAIQKTSGAILITGPTGSGKTTSTCALLRAIVGPPDAAVVKSVVSLEDPIEYAIDGVAQIELSRDGETTLDRMIRYLMRQDPDVIMVGEIRDKATASAAFQAALTGHLLLSTFHATDAAGAIARLLELGVDPFAIRGAVVNILSQRLVRRLCSCAQKRVENRTMTILGDDYRISQWFEPVGCDKCQGVGYSGRFLVAESLPLGSEEIGQAILARRDRGTLAKLARDFGMIPFGAELVRLVEAGQTSPTEALRVFGS